MHRLSPGTQVGAWRVEAWQGQGTYGAVYRAVRLGQESAGPVALKLSLHPWDPRFVREADLLARLSHPGIPRLLDRGVLRHPSGAVEHPFFVMEWVEGTPLYVWAEQHAPTGQQVCWVLAGLARTLEALHAAGAVHRDVKGDNVLVRLSDRFPVLIDFGSGHYQGAPRLTWQALAPGTPAYLSAQASLFEIRLARHRDAYYAPSAADDLYALGVTAYRLVMGQYPPPLDVRRDDEESPWQVSSPDPRPLLESNPQVDPRLREVILQLLSDSPEVRGTAAQVAKALEAAAEERVPERVPVPPPAAEVAPPAAPAPSGGRQPPERPRIRVHTRFRKPWLAVAAAGLCAVLMWSGQALWSSCFQVPEGGTSAVADSASREPPASKPRPSEKKPPAQEVPPTPRPGQARPDERGRCPVRKQVAINGGCWLEFLSMTTEECANSGYVPFKGKCYAPAHEPPRKPPPTSEPASIPE